jgi:hypothetical protein
MWITVCVPAPSCEAGEKERNDDGEGRTCSCPHQRQGQWGSTGLTQNHRCAFELYCPTFQAACRIPFGNHCFSQCSLLRMSFIEILHRFVRGQDQGDPCSFGEVSGEDRIGRCSRYPSSLRIDVAGRFRQIGRAPDLIGQERLCVGQLEGDRCRIWAFAQVSRRCARPRASEQKRRSTHSDAKESRKSRRSWFRHRPGPCVDFSPSSQLVSPAPRILFRVI